MKKRAVVGAVCVFLGSSASAIADRTIGVEAVASSTAKGKGDTFAAWRAVDDSTATAWCEGKNDEGVDETLTLTLAEPITVTRLDVYVGLHGSAKQYSDNNRVVKLSAQTASKVGGPMVMLAKATPIVSKYDSLVKLDLKTPRTIQVLQLGFAGITRGENLKANDTCITDVSLVSDKGEVVSFLYGVPPDAMASLPAAVNVLRTAVAGCEEKVLSYAVKFPLEHRIAAEEDSRTIKHKNVKSLIKACMKDSFPKIPVEADQPQLSAAGFGRVSLEAGSSETIRFDMLWTQGGWKLASVESH